MFRLVIFTGCLVAATFALFDPRTQMYTLHNGRTINFAGLDLQGVCRQAIMAMGGRPTDQLSDMMVTAVQNLQRVHGNNIHAIAGRDPMWKCLASRAPGGMMANAVGDYFDTAVESLHRPLNPFGYCNVGCSERGINAAALGQNLQLMSNMGLFGRKPGASTGPNQGRQQTGQGTTGTGTGTSTGGSTPSGGTGTNPLASMMGMMGTNPMASMMGSNPMASMMGTNPMASMMGTDPMASMMGPNPMASMFSQMANMFGSGSGSGMGSTSPASQAGASTSASSNGTPGTSGTSGSGAAPSSSSASTNTAPGSGPSTGTTGQSPFPMPGLSMPPMMPGFPQLSSALGSNPFAAGASPAGAQNPGATMQNMFQMATVFGPDGLLQDGPPERNMGMAGLGGMSTMGGVMGGLPGSMGGMSGLPGMGGMSGLPGMSALMGMPMGGASTPMGGPNTNSNPFSAMMSLFGAGAAPSGGAPSGSAGGAAGPTSPLAGMFSMMG